MARTMTADAGAGRRLRPRGRIGVAAVAAALALLVPASSAWAGRMVATGEDPDVACDARNDAGACHFLRVGLDYVRTGAPNPSAPILLFDEAPFHMRNAIVKAYGGSPPFSIDTQNPSQTDFNSFQITPSLFSAIVVASDYTCGSGISTCGDLNPNTYGQVNSSPSDPCYANDPYPNPQVPFELTCFTPDSDALIAPPGHDAINRFYNGGGGLFVGGGGDNGDGHADDLYYDFIGVPRGLLFNGDPSSITSGGSAIGFSAGDVSHLSACPPAPSFTTNIYLDCPYDAFFPLPAGSSLRVAELDQSGDPVTLFQDNDPPRTTITGAPPAMTVSRGPASASFSFAGSENFISFQCQLDNSGFTPCASPASYSNLGEGTHTFTVRAIDAAGNVEAAPPTSVFLIAFDRDGDGWTRFSNPPDCNDNNAQIHPFAFQPPGSTTSFNCSGKLVPFPQINPRVGFEVAPGASSSQFMSFKVSALPAGSTVSVTCAAKHCPFRASKFHVKKNNGQVSLTHLFHNKHFGVGQRIVIRVTHRGQIGGYLGVVIRRSAAPSIQHQCMNPGSTKPRAFCPQFT